MEKSVASKNLRTQKLSFGNQAWKELLLDPKSFQKIPLISPIDIHNIEALEKTLKPMVSQLRYRAFGFRALVMTPMHFGFKNSLVYKNLFSKLEASELHFFSQSKASAVANNLLASKRFFLDLGASGSRLYLLSYGNLVFSKELSFSANIFNQAMSHRIEKGWNIVLKEEALEHIKKQFGYNSKALIEGRDLLEKETRTLSLSKEDWDGLLLQIFQEFFDRLIETIEQIPISYRNPALKYPILLSGGGACLKSIDRFFSIHTNYKFQVSKDPLNVSILAGKNLLKKNHSLEESFEDHLSL